MTVVEEDRDLERRVERLEEQQSSWWQITTVSRAGSSSEILSANSPIGMSFEPSIRANSNSHGSRTSSSTGLSPASSLAFSPLAVMFS